jgi:hypothetical protein
VLDRDSPMLASSLHLDSYAQKLRIPEGYRPQIRITLGHVAGIQPPRPGEKAEPGLLHIRGYHNIMQPKAK